MIAKTESARSAFSVALEGQQVRFPGYDAPSRAPSCGSMLCHAAALDGVLRMSLERLLIQEILDQPRHHFGLIVVQHVAAVDYRSAARVAHVRQALMVLLTCKALAPPLTQAVALGLDVEYRRDDGGVEGNGFVCAVDLRAGDLVRGIA